jgi:hypothetical protein
MTAKIPANQRVYFIDGLASGRSIVSLHQPSHLTRDDEHSGVYQYRRVTHFRSAHFNRYTG